MFIIPTILSVYMLGIFHKKDIFLFKKEIQGTSLVVQQLRIRLPMEGTWAGFLVWEPRPHMLQLKACSPQQRPNRAKQMKKQKRNSAVVLDIKGLLKSRVPYIQSFKQLKQK